MTKIIEFQKWLNAHGAGITGPLGTVGPQTRAAVSKVFSNRNAAAVTFEQLKEFAGRIGCTVDQLRAVAKVESAGGGFDELGRPKILFERHYFHRLTGGKWSVSAFSNPKGGGYADPSWDKLIVAMAKDPDAAFASCSWGKFQIMGAHWHALGYPSVFDMAFSMCRSEAAHYEALVRFVLHNNLAKAMAAISTNPGDNAAFARGYNGPAYEKFSYHTKLAQAMKP